MVRQKAFTIINILGLSVGTAAFLLIMLYVRYEFGYDKHFKNAENIYRVTLDMNWENAALQETAIAPAPTAYHLMKDYADVLEGTRFTFLDQLTVGYQNENPEEAGKVFKENFVMVADSNFTRVFDIAIINGDKNNCLSSPNTLIISESLVKKYFGEEDPIGKLVTIGGQAKYTVNAVMSDIPENTHFKADIILSGQGRPEFNVNNWRDLSLYSYILLSKDADISSFPERFEEFEEKYYEPWKDQSKFRLQKMLEIHLKNDRIFDFARTNDVNMLYLLTGIAVLILLIACVNYMNLSSARALYRSKEVGIRKVCGANRKNLIIQFLSESMIMAVIAMFIAVVMGESFMPEFRNLTQANVSIDYGNNFIYIIVLALCIGLLSGSYPAFFTSSFKVVSIFSKMTGSAKGNILIRKILVIFQFVVMAILFIASGTVFMQMSFIKSKNLGFNKDQLIFTTIENQDNKNKIIALKTALNNNTAFTAVATSNLLPGRTPWGDHFIIEGEESFFPCRTFNIDHDFIPLMEMEIVSGRNFSRDYGTDSTACIINEAAAKKFGWTNVSAIGKEVKWNFSESWDYMITGNVVGVVKDFHFKSLREKIEPLILTMHLPVNTVLSARVNGSNIDKGINVMRDIYQNVNPSSPFKYHFLDHELDKLYMLEQRTSTIITYFVFLAVVIACLGLIGLSTFMAEKRFHEIGIRKTFGASMKQILFIFYKEFIVWVIVANIIAWPIAYFGVDNLLDNFAYRINVPIWVFFTAFIITIILTIITVSFMANRAATKNPVDALRYE